MFRWLEDLRYAVAPPGATVSNEAKRQEHSYTPGLTTGETSPDGHEGPRPVFDLGAACRHLAECDPCLAELIQNTAPFQIFARVKALGGNGRAPSPERMMKLRTSALRKAGLSAAKAAAMKDLAKKTIAGVVPSLEEARKLSDEELVKRLISVRGIGAWSVEMFLIFRLGRPDVLPIHDLGVKKGWSVAYGKKHMPKPKELLQFGERWRPYRTVASWYMWRAFERAGYATTNKIRPKPPRKKRAAAR